jgi:hypothetical protein
MYISYTERDAIATMVKQIMTDYESEIEDAYSNTEGEFKIAFSAKIKPKGEAKKLIVEMSFDPAKKIKDKIEGTIDDKQKQLFDDKGKPMSTGPE